MNRQIIEGKCVGLFLSGCLMFLFLLMSQRSSGQHHFDSEEKLDSIERRFLIPACPLLDMRIYKNKLLRKRNKRIQKNELKRNVDTYRNYRRMLNGKPPNRKIRMPKKTAPFTLFGCRKETDT